LVEPIRAELAKIDPEIPLARPRAMRDVVADELAGNRFALSLLALFAGVAALLATVGLYGVMSYTVGRRRREIGIRMALGSNTGDGVAGSGGDPGGIHPGPAGNRVGSGHGTAQRLARVSQRVTAAGAPEHVRRVPQTGRRSAPAAVGRGWRG